MKIRPITINGNESLVEFNSCELDEITILTGGYIITPRGEIIIVDEKDEHCNVFSAYINVYLEENDSSKIYDTATAMKILCGLECCVYSGIRYHEYISGKTESFDNEAITLAFPQEIEEITPIQKEICKRIIESNKSVLGNREKIYMSYESYPDTVYTKEQIMSVLNKKNLTENNIIPLKTLKIEMIDYNDKEHLEFLKKLMQSSDISFLWDLSDESLMNNQNENKYLILNENGERIGYINYSEPTEAFYGTTVSIYYAIDEKYRGQEYGKRAVEETSEWLFKEKNIDCIVAQVDVGNIHSINTLTKAGMNLVNTGDEYTTFIQRKNR